MSEPDNSRIPENRKAVMHFELLADRVEALPVVARWLYDEWGHRREGNSFPKTCERLAGQISRDRLPMYLLAVAGGAVVGCGALKVREMDLYPEREHWLGNVYVKPDWRGQGIASRLVQAIVARARRYEVSLLSLQTERKDGGLYARLGWRAVERVKYLGIDVTVMERHLDYNAERAHL